MRRNRAVLAGLAFVYIGLLTGLSLWMDRRLRSATLDAMSGSVRVIGREIATALEAAGDPVLPIEADARARVKAMLSDLTERSESVQALDVVAADGTIVASDDPSAVGRRLSPAAEVLKEGRGTRLVEPTRALAPEASYELYQPLRRDGEVTGYLRMVIASETLARIYAHHRTQMLGTAAIALAGVILVSILLQHQFSRSGAAAARAVEEILTGRIALPAVREGPFSRVFEEAGRLAQRLREEGSRGSVAMADQVEKLTQLHAALAHELKAPLHAIVLNLELLDRAIARDDDDARAKAARYVEVIRQEMARLERSVVALGATEKRDVAWKQIELGALVREVANLIAPRAELQGIHLVLDTPDGAFVDGNGDALARAVLNLALNAIESMPTGGQLMLAVASDEDSWCVRVEDEGGGFAPEVLDRLDRPATTKATGTGVGLYLAQAVVSAHGGRFEIVSRAGTGTRCDVILPRSREVV